MTGFQLKVGQEIVVPNHKVVQHPARDAGGEMGWVIRLKQKKKGRAPSFKFYDLDEELQRTRESHHHHEDDAFVPRGYMLYTTGPVESGMKLHIVEVHPRFAKSVACLARAVGGGCA